MGEPPFRNFPFVFTLWRIPTKRENVPAAELFRILEKKSEAVVLSHDGGEQVG